MNDDRIVRLLEEIRDLQRQHLEHYREAVRNQEESIRMQRELHEVARRRLRVVPFLVVLAAALAVLAAWGILRLLL